MATIGDIVTINATTIPPGARKMTRRGGKSSALPLVLDQHRDGPPNIQRVAIERRAGRVEHGVSLIDAKGLSDMPAPQPGVETLIREPTVVQVEWPDPADMSARLRRADRPGGKVEAKKIRGYKRVWMIDTLHGSSPDEITEELVKAAQRFVDDHQRREGALVGGYAPSSGDMGPEDVRVAAGIRYDDAAEAMGIQGSYIVFHVAILNWTVSAMALHLGVHRDRTFGRLQAALERLREHYDQGKRKRARHSPATAIIAAMTVTPIEDTGLPPERSGRWDRKKVPA